MEGSFSSSPRRKRRESLVNGGWQLQRCASGYLDEILFSVRSPAASRDSFLENIRERERERDSLLSFSKNRTETTNFLFRMFEKRRQEFIPNWSDRDVKEGNKLWILIIIRPNACINERNDYTVSLILIQPRFDRLLTNLIYAYIYRMI